MVFVAETMVCVTRTVVWETNTMVSKPETIFFVTRKMVFLVKKGLSVAKTMVSGIETMVCVMRTILATTQTSVTILGATILVSVNLKGSRGSKVLQGFPSRLSCVCGRFLTTGDRAKMVPGGGPHTMRRVTAVSVLDGFRLDLTFDDGVHGIVDLSELAGKGVFSSWSDRKFFENVRIGSAGELEWGSQIDLCPDSLYLRITGKKPSDLFPSLRREMTHA
jgi:hypothetical protein